MKPTGSNDKESAAQQMHAFRVKVLSSDVMAKKYSPLHAKVQFGNGVAS
jgi:hypothetical protein